MQDKKQYSLSYFYEELADQDRKNVSNSNTKELNYYDEDLNKLFQNVVSCHLDNSTNKMVCYV